MTEPAKTVSIKSALISLAVAFILGGGLGKLLTKPQTITETITETKTDTAYVQIIKSIPITDYRTVWDTTRINDTVYITRTDSVKTTTAEDWTWRVATKYPELSIMGTVSIPSKLVSATPLFKKEPIFYVPKYSFGVDLPLGSNPIFSVGYRFKSSNNWLHLGIQPYFSDKALKQNFSVGYMRSF